ncbi:membrane bound O-acyl transferase family-domain-containing protein [Ampelomyces quisqualis]|uniref:Membrane bound O-acyl transferase family-domain-containing protein n=1 Tax=Ampelomyces quisqualis TaxID=50730 RepID=A0A6A5QM19_AMPQU|nr:membrane bound O-acyl transferase family-domain-containing protein [Ampelomyces quisqualis]
MLDAHKKDSWPRSHYDVIEHYYAQYDKQIASGEYQPFLYPWGTLGAAVVIVYLLIPHQNRPWLKKCRFLAFAWITGFATYTMTYTRAKGMAPAFGIGLMSSWSVAWCSAILVCNDCQTDFQRIERLEGVFGRSRQQSLQDPDKRDSATDKKEVQNEMIKGTSGPSRRHGTFAWQPYPLTPFIERVDWVLDIFCNFRGAGWNWRTSALPPPPRFIQEEVRLNSVAGTRPPKTSNRIHAGQVKGYTTRRALLRANTYTFVTGYILLDLLKTLLMHDPYFWSPYPSRSHPAPKFYPSSPTLIHMMRLTLSMLSIQTALSTIFSLGPIFFCGIVGPSLLGARAHPFMYPDAWARYTAVLDKGLAGWWGNWWHQTFRFAFSEPARRMLESTGSPLSDKHSIGAKTVHLAVAFGLSGAVHACGSHTSAGSTRPLHDPLTFFMVQAAGVWAEAALSLLVAPRRRRLLPLWVRRCGTFVYVHAWFYFTGHRLCNDFARGGVWLFEPVPLSLFRGLGFGADARDGWWCWGGVTRVVRWHVGDRWWTTGIAF